MSERFSVISNLAGPTCIPVDYCRDDFFSRESLNLIKLPSLRVYLKTTLNLQNGIYFLVVRLKSALRSSVDLAVH